MVRKNPLAWKCGLLAMSAYDKTCLGLLGSWYPKEAMLFYLISDQRLNMGLT